MRHPRAPVCCALLVAALLAGCSAAQPGGPTERTSALDAAARSLLAAWTTEHGGDAPDAVIAAGPLVRQDGDWTSDAYKQAAVDGLVNPSPGMTVSGVAGGTVQWADDSTTSTAILSPAAALSQALPRRVTPDSPVAPLVVLAASATSTTVSTSRGTATVPAWELTLQDSPVRLVVVAAPVTVPTAPVTPGRELPGVAGETVAAEGISVGADGRTLTVRVVGAQGPASQICGEDYTASTVADDRAVVITVVRHHYSGPGSDEIACAAVGADRTAVTVLDTALAGRPVLDVTSALPVPVS